MSKNIKNITVFKTNFNNMDGLNIEYDAAEFLHHFTEFDPKGHIIKEIIYTEDGNIDQEIAYKYSEKDLLIEEYACDGEGEFLEKKTFNYNEFSQVSQKLIYYIDDSFDTVNYKYVDGLLIEKVLINCDDEVEEREELNYLDRNLISNESFDAENKRNKSIKTKFNQANQPIEVIEWNKDDNRELKTIFEYDELNRKKEILIYSGDKLIARQQLFYHENSELVVEVIDENQYKKNTAYITYDDNGNNIEQVEYNRQEEFNNKISKTYNEFNDVVTTEVLIDKHGDGLNLHYAFRYEYSYF